MEETQETQKVGFQEESKVSFPTVGQTKKSGNGKTFLILGILLVVGILGFVIFKNANKQNEEVTQPQVDEIVGGVTEATSPVPTATSTPKAIVRSGVDIEVQNGTGIPGEAAYLESQLKVLGYTSIKVGNASGQNQTTTKVTFAKSLSIEVVNELTAKLKSLYKTVEVSTSSTMTNDVLVVTGLKTGATAKPSSTPTSSPKVSPTPTPTATTF